MVVLYGKKAEEIELLAHLMALLYANVPYRDWSQGDAISMAIRVCLKDKELLKNAAENSKILEKYKGGKGVN